MTTLTVNIDNDKDLPVLKEILNRFGLRYKIDKQAGLDKDGEKLYKKLKQSFGEIKEWEAGNLKLQNAKDAIAEIEAELANDIWGCFNVGLQERPETDCQKHRQILNDIRQLSDELAEKPTLGTDLGQNVYKIRLAISGIAKGKSDGARVITYIKVVGQTVILSEIYLKNEYDTVDVDAVIQRLIDEGVI